MCKEERKKENPISSDDRTRELDKQDLQNQKGKEKLNFFLGLANISINIRDGGFVLWPAVLFQPYNI